MRRVPLRSLTKAIRPPVAEGQAPQSPAQVVQVSSPLQAPSPQAAGQAPQSAAQSSQVSPPLQVPSPQDVGHAPQSAVQVAHVSSPLHAPSPQYLQGPQSFGHVAHVSFAAQTPFPQPPWPLVSSAAAAWEGVAPPHPVRTARRATSARIADTGAGQRAARSRISHRVIASPCQGVESRRLRPLGFSPPSGCDVQDEAAQIETMQAHTPTLIVLQRSGGCVAPAPAGHGHRARILPRSGGLPSARSCAAFRAARPARGGRGGPWAERTPHERRGRGAAVGGRA